MIILTNITFFLLFSNQRRQVQYSSSRSTKKCECDSVSSFANLQKCLWRYLLFYLTNMIHSTSLSSNLAWRRDKILTAQLHASISYSLVPVKNHGIPLFCPMLWRYNIDLASKWHSRLLKDVLKSLSPDRQNTNPVRMHRRNWSRVHHLSHNGYPWILVDSGKFCR